MLPLTPRTRAYGLIARAFNEALAAYDPELAHDALAAAVAAGCTVVATSSPHGSKLYSTHVYDSASPNHEVGRDPSYWEENADRFNYIRVDGRVLTGWAPDAWPRPAFGFTF